MKDVEELKLFVPAVSPSRRPTEDEQWRAFLHRPIPEEEEEDEEMSWMALHGYDS